MRVAARYGIDGALYGKATELALGRCGISNFGYDALFEACKIIKPDLDDRILSDWQGVVETPHFFPDTLVFLNRFPKSRLVLVTTGGNEYQRAKIATHGLDKYFSEIQIVPSPKYQHIIPVSSATYIDDSPREIDAMKTLHPHVFCVLVRQPAPWEKQKVSISADIYCPDLISVADHISQ